jgi:hypothetical protein
MQLVVSSGTKSAESPPHWDGSGHFFAAAAEAMRRILIENARRKKLPKHGGGRKRIWRFFKVKTRAAGEELGPIAVAEVAEKI